MSDMQPLLDRDALAKVLGLSPETVKRLASKSPDRLPPRVRAMHVLRWDPTIVRTWLEQQSVAPRRAGRPRQS